MREEKVSRDTLHSLIAELTSLVRKFWDPHTECDLDHHGNCQAHNYFGDGRCPHAVAESLVREAEAATGDGDREVMDICNLSGQELLDALTTAWNEGQYKGWTFSEISKGASVLPMTVYDEKPDDHEITRHVSVVSTAMNKGRITDITLAVTTKDGTKFQDGVIVPVVE